MTTIRPVAPGDFVAIKQMQADWHEEYPRYQPWDDSFFSVSPYFVLAEHDGELAGYIAGRELVRPNLHLSIEDLFVRKKHRGRDGVVRQLTKGILDRARAHNISYCKLCPICGEKQKPKLVRFYERLGFTWEPDRIHMIKQLFLFDSALTSAEERAE